MDIARIFHVIGDTNKERAQTHKEKLAAVLRDKFKSVQLSQEELTDDELELAAGGLSLEKDKLPDEDM